MLPSDIVTLAYLIINIKIAKNPTRAHPAKIPFKSYLINKAIINNATNIAKHIITVFLKLLSKIDETNWFSPCVYTIGKLSLFNNVATYVHVSI